MGLRRFVRRLATPLEELDAATLQERYAGLGLTSLDELPLRVPVKVGGEVRRLRVVPRAGSPWLEVVVNDGRGEVVAMFTGRRSIAGLHPGRSVLLEGVAHVERTRRVMLNPAYTLLAPADEGE